MSLAFRLAWREMRGGLAGFRIFLVCLALGVAAIAAIGSVRMAVEAGLSAESTTLLGGDAEMRFTYRRANAAEWAFMRDRATAVSEIFDFRSMVISPDEERGLVQVKAVDSMYPLYGAVGLSPDMPLADAFALQNGLPGMVVDQALIDRLGLRIGDLVQLGAQSFELRAALTFEPDGGASAFSLGPRAPCLRPVTALPCRPAPGWRGWNETRKMRFVTAECAGATAATQPPRSRVLSTG